MRLSSTSFLCTDMVTEKEMQLSRESMRTVIPAPPPVLATGQGCVRFLVYTPVDRLGRRWVRELGNPGCGGALWELAT